MAEPALPLQGLRVIEFTRMVMGPTCGMVLADLDAEDPRGREIVLRRVAGADVFSENFKAGAMQRLGLDPAALAALNLRLVYVSHKGFLPRPYEHRSALFENNVLLVARHMMQLAVTGRSAAPMPSIGEHGHALLRELGYADAEIATLQAEGVIAAPPAPVDAG